MDEDDTKNDFDAENGFDEDEVDADDVWSRAFGPVAKVEEKPSNDDVEMEEEQKDWNDEADWGASDPFLI